MSDVTWIHVIGLVGVYILSKGCRKGCLVGEVCACVCVVWRGRVCDEGFDRPHGMLRLRSMGIATLRGWLFVGPCSAGHGRDGCGGPGRARWPAPLLRRQEVHAPRLVRGKGFAPDCKKSWGELLEPVVEHVDHLDEYLEGLSKEQKRAVWDDHKTVGGLGMCRQ